MLFPRFPLVYYVVFFFFWQQIDFQIEKKSSQNIVKFERKFIIISPFLIYNE